MRVVLVMPYASSPSWGVQNVAYNLVRGFIKLCRELERADIKITILSNAGSSLKPQKELFLECSQLSIMYYKQIPPVTFLGDVQNMLLSKKYFYPVLSSSDVVHSHEPLFSLGVANIFRHLNVIHNFHGLPWNEKRHTNSSYLRFSYDTITLRAQKLAKLSNTKFVAISNFVRREIQRTLGISDNKIFTIPDPISDEFFKITKKEDAGLIFYPARLIPRKNHIPLLEALGILRNDGFSEFRLALTGIIEDRDYFNKMMRTIHKYSLHKNVVFLGKIPKEKLFECYSKASVVVLTSMEESFSLAVGEAMATGTPVIASPVGIVPEAVSNGKNGYIINPGDPKVIAEKLRLVLEDDKKRKVMGKRARKTAEKWRSENIAKKLLRLWKGII
ncbi:glycosyltransferase family 4 protein [Thermococcus zilligii]|uniref:glycosyltransferase family 4 protein n=1 Tax=Thermococcus zilligii TaxID=54076 RepID=UPI000299E932|nr:glycosyltransferase family 4 protein [Thermococcus zilligii]